MEVELLDGSKAVYTWADATRDPGWCKIDWLISDSARGKLANASNVLDTTWEGPDGKIVPLDGFLDPDFQEVYLDTDSVPLFKKLVKELSADTVDDYVDALEHEIWKYTVEHPSYGKVARRLYNVFRMNGHYAEAAFIRVNSSTSRSRPCTRSRRWSRRWAMRPTPARTSTPRR
jgi:hypothetical protein